MKFHGTTLLMGATDKMLQIVFKSPSSSPEWHTGLLLSTPLAPIDRRQTPLAELLDFLENKYHPYPGESWTYRRNRLNKMASTSTSNNPRLIGQSLQRWQSFHKTWLLHRIVTWHLGLSEYHTWNVAFWKYTILERTRIL